MTDVLAEGNGWAVVTEDRRARCSVASGMTADEFRHALGAVPGDVELVGVEMLHRDGDGAALVSIVFEAP